jgi:hypothetical protein
MTSGKILLSIIKDLPELNLTNAQKQVILVHIEKGLQYYSEHYRLFIEGIFDHNKELLSPDHLEQYLSFFPNSNKADEIREYLNQIAR